MDKNGNLVAFSAKENFQKKVSYKGFSNNANDSLETVMSVSKKEGNEFGFFYSRPIEYEGEFLGVILIEVDLQKFEKAWVENGETIIITDSSGIIILSTEPSWKGLTEEQAFQIKTLKIL